MDILKETQAAAQTVNPQPRQNLPANLQETALPAVGVFGSIDNFVNAQRMAKLLSASEMVPDTYHGKPENCTIALELSQRIGASVLAIMQNLYIVHGRPAWSSQFLISCVNASGKFTPLRYTMTGTRGTDSYGCVAWAYDKRNGEKLEGVEVTMAMAKAEGWTSKNGSKWRTLPDLMLHYRAATLFARLYAPELTMGIQTDDEVIDITPIVTDPAPGGNAAPFKLTASASPDAKPVSAEAVFNLAAELNKVISDNAPVTVQEVIDYVHKAGIAETEAVKNLPGIINAILTPANEEA